ncbi:U32 family peptidase [Deinococcus peraridilitoris]|uniref:Collagenase-like protease n=1 Tax=Deinococcus peraridilitoris (strain DSM 19664 / LMG 22246 / CIP 109416 / KR-200) TaxID=937777 RepID=L0A531_DEIPD|nr:U32 family peptidase [Deinococcus peraridilitoris]AFZ68287.1 collagenase-like protease [Deinococcus peraridilitoris DSM 19664]
MASSLVRPRVKPELMSPAGGWPQLRAAVEAGADAVYFGLDSFHARAKVGFTDEELPEIMRYLHERGVLGFVTFNVLVFDRELYKAEEKLTHLARSGVDAIIVQDLGVARLAHQLCPDLPIHGSTQMSITSAEGAELARRFGASRVVLGRELSLLDIERIAQATDIELETFVHGALCVSYSGQCFSSEAWGGRSANRGQCAQACRLPYDLIVDGSVRDLHDARYLLSPGDLYALHQVPDLVRMGVNCLKIEGRYKDSEYVALTTAAYRKAIDEAWKGLPLSVTPDEERDLEQVYSRGLGAHFISGTNHQQVVRGRAPRHRGVKIGEVVGVSDAGVRVKLLERVRLGDGVVFDAADWRSPGEREEGGHLYGLWRGQEKLEEVESGQVELRFGRGAVDLSRVRAGDWVWRTHDPTLAARVRPYIDPADPLYTRPVFATFVGVEGEVPRLTLRDETGRAVEVAGETPLQGARNRALGEDTLREQLGKLGGTPFHLEGLQAELPGAVFMPVSELNALRRQAVEQLTELRGKAPQRDIQLRLREVLASVTPETVEGEGARLHLLVRTPEQLDAAIALRPASITLDYLELYGLKPAVTRVREAGLTVRVASPRVLKPTEQNIEKFLLSLDAEILVRSGGLLEGLQDASRKPALVGDFSLNAANVLTARELLSLGLSRVTPTHDLNARQVTELAQLVGPGRLEVIAYQHLPVFHTEHCVFSRFLSEGTDYTNCGHPCESHRVALRDEKGLMHPVMADVGCRNTVFGAQAQTAARHLQSWRAVGLSDFRLEFVHESAEDVLAVSRAFSAFFTGEIGERELEARLAALSAQGVTEGSLFVPGSFEELPQLQLM